MNLLLDQKNKLMRTYTFGVIWKLYVAIRCNLWSKKS